MIPLSLPFQPGDIAYDLKSGNWVLVYEVTTSIKPYLITRFPVSPRHYKPALWVYASQLIRVVHTFAGFRVMYKE